MEKDAGWSWTKGSRDEDRASSSCAGPMMQSKSCTAVGNDEGGWEGGYIPKSSCASSSKCSGEVGWRALCPWKVDYWFTVRSDWSALTDVTVLKMIGSKIQSLLIGFQHAVVEEFTGIGRSLVGPLLLRKYEASLSPRDKVTEELPTPNYSELHVPSPVEEVTSQSQISHVNQGSSPMAGPSHGMPEDSIDHQSDQTGFYLVDWFLKPLAGPMIPMSSLVFCRGSPMRLSPSKSQYEAYWNGIHVSVIVEIPCDGLATKQYLESFAKSISILRQIHHPSFAQVYGWCLIRKGSASELGIVMEWCNSGSVLSMMRSQKSRGKRNTLGWKHKMELAKDYIEGVRHLQEHHQLLLGEVDLGNLLVQCSKEDDHFIFRGKIADLSTARFMLSSLPYSGPAGAWEASQSRSLSAEKDICSLRRIFWSIAMLGETHAETFWNLPAQFNTVGDKSIHAATIDFCGLHPLLLSQNSGQRPPNELWRLMEDISRGDGDNMATVRDVCDALSAILQHYVSPRCAASTDKFIFPQKEQCLQNMGVLRSRSSGGGTCQPEDLSSSSKKNDIPKIRDDSIKIGRRPVARCFSGIFKGCFMCAQAHPVDEWDTTKGSSMIKSLSSVSMKNDVDVHQPAVGQAKDDLILQDSMPIEYETDEMNIESIQVLKKNFMEGTNWRNFRTEVLKYWKNHPQSSPLRKLANMVEKIPLKATHEELQAILCIMFQSRSSQKNITRKKGWKAVQSLMVDTISPDDLVPCAGFGISAKRLDEVIDVILALPPKFAGLFEFDSKQKLSPVRSTSRDISSHSQSTARGGNLFCITKVQGQRSLDYTVKRSKWIDCQLRVKLRGHVQRGEDVEEIIDALKHRMTDRVLTWVVHTEASILLRKLPSICTFRGVCQLPLALVSDQYDSRTLYDILQSQVYPGWKTSWTWLEKLVVAKRITQCLLEFHKVALVHTILTSKSVLINQQLNVKLSLGPERFVDCAIPVSDAEWTSPEKWFGDSIHPANDLYSLGVILWEIISGRKPWTGLSPSQILVSVINGKRPDIDPSWNRNYISLIESCWAPDPQSRPKCMEVMTRLDDMQEAARELVSLSSGSAGSGVIEELSGQRFEFWSATGMSSKDLVPHARTIKSTESEVHADSKPSTTRKDDVAERRTRMSEFTESTLEDPGTKTIADFRSAQASSDVGVIGSLQESECSNDNYIVNEFLMIRNIQWSNNGKQCTDRNTGLVYSIARSKKWVMPSPWSWKMEILGPWIAWRSTSIFTCIHRKLRLERTVSSMAREIAIFKKLMHPNLVKLIEVIEDGEHDMLLVSEHINGTSLVQACYESKPSLSEAAARHYMIKIIECLEYLHSCHVIHRDLRPDNIFLFHGQDPKLKLSASSCWLPERTSMCTDVCGDPHFYSPEMCDLHEGKSYCGYKADIYALGVCLHVMVYGRPPYQSSSEVQLMDAIKNDSLTFPHINGRPLSDPLKDLLSRVLHKDPQMRLSLQGIADHKWLGGHQRRVLPSMGPVPMKICKTDTRKAVSLNLSKLFEGLPFIRSELKEFLPGQQIFLKGGDVGSLYVVKEGWCRCSLGQGFNEYLAFPGSVFGCPEFLMNDNQHRNVELVHAVVPTSVSQIKWDSAQSGVVYQVIVACSLAAFGAGVPAIIICFLGFLILCLWFWLNSVSSRALKTLVNNHGKLQ